MGKTYKEFDSEGQDSGRGWERHKVREILRNYNPNCEEIDFLYDDHSDGVKSVERNKVEKRTTKRRNKWDEDLNED